MLEEQLSLEESLFEQAEQKASAAERAAFLDGACRNNPAMRARLEVLLEGHFGAARFLTESLKRPAPTEPPAGSPVEQPPAPTLGRYQLLEKIGEGGFGEVWMAEQREPVRRRVALKIIKLGMDTEHFVARFEAERQALALMDHPNIAKVFDAGASDTGRPYFVMEMVRGTAITEFCDHNAVPTHERLKLFVLVCQAIHHAHQKGVIHRDIKPSNILVALHDGVPVPKVIDFGIAKATQGQLTENTLFTQFQHFIGTPAYISPEQAETSGLDIDTRSDIYSLGVLLYELLVGKTPFDAREMVKGGVNALRQIIREKEPVKPSTKLKTLSAVELTTTAQRRQTDSLKLTHLLRGDLDWIVMKCLEKDRARRYESANGLAMDIQRYLGNEPIAARPPSTLYRFQKMVRRNKLAFATSALVFLVAVFGISAVILVQHRANQDYRQRLYVSEISRAGTAWQAGRSSELRTLLDRCPASLRKWEWNFLHRQANRWDQALVLDNTNGVGAELSMDGGLAAVLAPKGIRIRDVATGQWLIDIPFQVEWHSQIATSPRGEYLATLFAADGRIAVWNMRRGESMAEMQHGGWTRGLAWSSNGERLASGGDDDTVRIWNAKTGQKEREFPITADVTALAFSPDDRTLAVGTSRNKTVLLDLISGVVKRTFRTRCENIRLLKFSPDGRRLAIAGLSADARDDRVWSLEEEGSLDLGKGAAADSFSFSPDGRQLCVADVTGTICIWDLDQRAEIERFSAQARWARLLPDGRILSAGRDGRIRIWQARQSPVQQLKGYTNALRTLAFSRDSRWLVAAGLDRKVFVWDAPMGQLAGIYTNHLDIAFAAAFSPDGSVATASGDRMLEVWNPASRTRTWSKSLEPASDAYWVVFSPDGRRLYAASQTDSISICDAATGQRFKTISGFGNTIDGLAVSPDGRLLAICNKTKLTVWAADGSRMLWQVDANPERSAVFSPDGAWIATGDRDGKVSLWDVASAGRVRHTLTGHAASVSGVSFDPDGSRLVSSSFDGQVKVWDWQAGAELLNLPLPNGSLAWHVVFSPDGKTIAAAGGDGVVTLWKTE